MKLSINDRPVGTSAADGDTLEALLDSLRDRGEIGRDEVVVRLEVDRRPWHAADVDTLTDARLEGIQQVCIDTDDLHGYARRILQDGSSMLAVLEEATGRVAGELRSGEQEKSNADLFNLLSALQQFLACLHQVKNTCGLEGEALGLSSDAMKAVSDSLELIQASQESEDWMSLATHLEADLLPALGRFQGVLAQMSDRI
ncbi:MAG: hypothetical protein ACYS8K_01715 [Planctomycetota bacterium]|jgi:hypothetical protein